ncbi:uncharacterized protein LOC129911098 [Episyrphus balteatus]|uniref:uncharacterized protein LOC129911098 n=1 Tax=Episyrphus balteatus TaxID=286459 RepID=UPI002485A8D8|nr:uncharacterized protein LOC129911098 [Episyrphus balteatus]
MWRQTMPLFRKNLLLSTAIACTIQFCIYITMHGMFMWFPFISHNMVEFRNNNPLNSSRICDVINAKIQFEDNSQKIDGVKHCTEKLENGTFLLTMLMEFVYGLGFIVVGFVLQIVKKVHILFFILFAFGTCGILINFIYDTTLALVVYNMLFLCGVGIQVLSEIVVDLYPTNLRAMALCISLMFGRLGGVFGAYMIALLLATNCEMTFNIAGMGLVVSAFLTFLIPKVKNLENKPVVG